MDANQTRGAKVNPAGRDTAKQRAVLAVRRSGRMAREAPGNGRADRRRENPQRGNDQKRTFGHRREVAVSAYVGWDIIVTDDGYKIIEGNNYSDVNLLQIHRPLLADPRVRRFYLYHGIIP